METSFQQLIPYCVADPEFFDTPGRMRDGESLLDVARRRPPDGWERHEHQLWVLLRPSRAALPEQGWKIHVSSTLADADEVSALVWHFCVSHGLAAKFKRSLAAVRLANSKYAERAGSGKLITIYPVDDYHLTKVLPELSDLLASYSGPYVLSDLRFSDSPVYVRYGGFHPVMCTAPDGEQVPAIRTPDGYLVPDVRTPSFEVPDWVEPPDVLRDALRSYQAQDGGELPYRIERALHFSNGGGVYFGREESSGKSVVLIEARPHAGIDRDGEDSVARLQRQRAVLERLRGLDCVPSLVGYHRVWEHHFLVEEYVEGKTLMEEVFARYPLAGPDADEEALAAYTRWAVDVLAKVDHAVLAVHGCGVRYGDLHPGNIIVRPDGGVSLVDFELAVDLADDRPPALGAPGFVAPGGLSGPEADWYALNCLRLWVFLPLSPMQDRDPAKILTLVRQVERRFPVPQGFGARLLTELRDEDAPPVDRAAAMFEADRLDWAEIRDALVLGIHAGATAERRDRLFPGDPGQFAHGGFTFADGAAGVLHALHQAGAAVPEEYVAWLVAAARRCADPHPGLYDGLHGVAYTLEQLGRRDVALELLEQARGRHHMLSTPGMRNGLAGAGLNLLHFAAVTSDRDLYDEAERTAERLARQLDGTETPDADMTGRAGLLHGFTGAALFFLRMHAHTGDDTYLDVARSALRRDMAAGQNLPDGTFQLTEGSRYLAYLGNGSSGLAIALTEYLKYREEPTFASVVEKTRKACRAEFIRHPGLFVGRAGTIAALCHIGAPEDRDVIEAHVRRLAWHAVSSREHVAFPGAQLLRLSMDLATGTAGVLAALCAAFEGRTPVLPHLPCPAHQEEKPDTSEGR